MYISVLRVCIIDENFVYNFSIQLIGMVGSILIIWSASADASSSWLVFGGLGPRVVYALIVYRLVARACSCLSSLYDALVRKLLHTVS